jgi:hypothetical protein
MRFQTVVVLILLLAGFALRLSYLIHSHPFFDEFTTVLAARQILQSGWPLLPSGLFYEHGLLATYLIAPFVALFLNMPVDAWQPAHWGLMLARWPSVLVGTVTIPVVYVLGRRLMLHPFGTAMALMAAGMFAISPEGVIWGGRARMYALAMLLGFVTVFLAFRGSVHPAPARFRWWALAFLLAGLLTQLATLLLVPPLLVAMVSLGWWTTRGQAACPWFLRKSIIFEGGVLLAVIGLAIFVKRLGQPLGVPALAIGANGIVWAELFDTIAYQTTLHFTWPDTEQFLARQFGVLHHLWLFGLTIVGLALSLMMLLINGRREGSNLPLLTGNIFLLIVFGLIIVEMVTLLAPFRRNPRYMVMFLPLFYLVGANATIYVLSLPVRWFGFAQRWQTISIQAITALVLVGIAAIFGYNDLRIAMTTPEPAYEQAFAMIKSEWQVGDSLLTMNTPAAELYLGQVDGFTVQNEADQFLLNHNGVPVDRWVGTPWVGTADAFRSALDEASRTWFVIDTIRQPVYFRGNWQAIVNSQFEPVWQGDNVLVYRTRPDRVPLVTEPAEPLEARFNNKVVLSGFSLDSGANENGSPALKVVLFWQPVAELADDYTVFLHLRNSRNEIVAQYDSQPLGGVYPTSQWQPGEQVIDPVIMPLPADLPPGTYQLVTGLYQLDTLARMPVGNDTSGENVVVLKELTWP